MDAGGRRAERERIVAERLEGDGRGEDGEDGGDVRIPPQRLGDGGGPGAGRLGERRGVYGGQALPQDRGKAVG